jgi:hypothetical protein
MAIDTPDVALLDFREHAGPALVDDQSADFGELRASVTMVELEHDRIADPAVSAGMRC